MARHITSLNINGYRGLCDFFADDIADINILLGNNNSGKTSVLEVLDTFSAITSPSKWLNNSVYRNSLMSGLNPCIDLHNLFNINYTDMPIDVEYTDTLGKKNNLILRQKTEDVRLDLKSIKDIDRIGYRRITQNIEKYSMKDITEHNMENVVVECKHSTMTFDFNNEKTVSTDFFEFSNIIRSKSDIKCLFKTQYEYPYKYITQQFNLSDIIENQEMYEELISVLKVFDEDITQVFADNENNSVVYKIASKKNEKALPISVFGDGLKLALSIFAALPKARDGIMLIDEFNSSLHTSQISKVLQVIITICKRFNIQLFMTTHSLEAVDKVIECCDDFLDDLRIIRINKKTKQTYAKVINGNNAKQLRQNNEAELR